MLQPTITVAVSGQAFSRLRVQLATQGLFSADVSDAASQLRGSLKSPLVAYSSRRCSSRLLPHRSRLRSVM